MGLAAKMCTNAALLQLLCVCLHQSVVLLDVPPTTTSDWLLLVCSVTNHH